MTEKHYIGQQTCVECGADNPKHVTFGEPVCLGGQRETVYLCCACHLKDPRWQAADCCGDYVKTMQKKPLRAERAGVPL